MKCESERLEGIPVGDTTVGVGCCYDDDDDDDGRRCRCNNYVSCGFLFLEIVV